MGGTISNYISAIGTFAVWLGFECPRCEWLFYVVRGLLAFAGPPDKVRVHFFPLPPDLPLGREAFLDLPDGVAALHAHLLGNVALAPAPVAIQHGLHPRIHGALEGGCSGNASR